MTGPARADTRPEGPLTLAIETSNPSAAAGGHGIAASVALGRGGQAIALEPVRSGAEAPGPALTAASGKRPRGGHDDDLVAALDRLCRRAGVRPRDLGRVAVSLGPGGYTSLRIAVACARMIARSGTASLIGVPTALVAARVRLRAPAPPHRLGVALASKQGTTCLTIIMNEGGSLRAGPLEIVGVDAVPAAPEGAALLADAFLPEPIRARAEALGWRLEPLALDAIGCLEAAELDGPLVAEPARVLPMYAREPEAVTLWRQRHGATGAGVPDRESGGT